MRRIRTLFLVGFATLNLLAPVPLAMAGDDASLREAFDASDYTTCDADALASAWGKSLDEAKAHIGFKLTEGSPELLEQELSEARVAGLDTNSTCYFHERGGYSYTDAEVLAGYWGVDVLEAKALISYKLGSGDTALLTEALQAAHAAPAAGDEGDEHGAFADAVAQDLESFFASDYQYCDAVMVAQQWSTSLEDAKATIGYKVRTGYTEMVDVAIDEGRKAAHARGEFCYVDSTVEDTDVAQLAVHWKLSESETRLKLDQLLATGEGGRVEAELVKLRGDGLEAPMRKQESGRKPKHK